MTKMVRTRTPKMHTTNEGWVLVDGSVCAEMARRMDKSGREDFVPFVQSDPLDTKGTQGPSTHHTATGLCLDMSNWQKTRSPAAETGTWGPPGRSWRAGPWLVELMSRQFPWGDRRRE